MKPTIFVVTGALALGLLAACDRKPEEATRANTTTYQTGAAAGGTGAMQSNTPTTPANAGAPNAAEKREGRNPVQGQVDPKQKEQHKDFQQSGDGAGPKHPGGG